jgi:hypothetical protein
LRRAPDRWRSPSPKQLIDLGVLAKPFFKFVRLQNPAPSYQEEVKGNIVMHRLFRSAPGPKCLELGVVLNDERNRAIDHEVSRAKQYGLPPMILVGRQKHGEKLDEILTQTGVRCVITERFLTRTGIDIAEAMIHKTRQPQPRWCATMPEA